MSTEFVLVRHATCALTASTLLGRCIDAPLDEVGRGEAQALALHLSARSAALLQSSPRLRARQTAAPVAARLNLPLVTNASLDEIDFGRWAGLSFAELHGDDTWRHWNAARSHACTPLRECMQQIQQRIVQHLSALLTHFSEQRVIIITHAELIRAALLHYLGLSCDAYSQLDIHPASVTTVQLSAAGVDVVRINERVSEPWAGVEQ